MDEGVVVAATPDLIDKAAEFLRAGELVAFPTETVYGLGADATNDDAVARIYQVKGRPASNPLIIHVSGIDAAKELAHFDDRSDLLAGKFWPGPLTLILLRRDRCRVTARTCAGLDTIALRMPAHDAALALLKACDLPIAGPSANVTGRTSPTTARHVRDGLGDGISTILDGGPCKVGVESTVLSLSGDTAILLRPGGVPAEAISPLVGSIAEPVGASEDSPTSPGRAKSHYAPTLPVRLGATKADAGEALLAFGANVPIGADKVLNLSPRGDIDEAAANLYRMLVELDEPKFVRIAVMNIPDIGVGHAINDRLLRAAAPRPDC